MYEITRKISAAYWPPGPNGEFVNSSADRKAGNAFVDTLTLGELLQFFTEMKAGPVFCVVKEHLQETLKKFPPFIEEKKERCMAAMEQAVYAFTALKKAVNEG